ncbi:RNA-directed DNA polymerase, eukaryota, reverse transcriptase zinc-binding domain protein [Tanacetum coccineum]
MDLKISSWNIRRLGKLSKQNDMKELIAEENISICVVLETRLKGNKVKKIGDRLFGRWNWFDNSLECNRACRILVGWDNEKIQCMIVHAFDQAITGRLRKKLWNDLSNYKNMINDNTWIIMGDLNVSLNLEDHSEGISCMTQDIKEFRDCTNVLKMEDICSSGLHYTWIISLLNLKSSVLKKIDKVTGNEEFFMEYLRAHVVFLPYGILDHSPAVLTSPKTIKAKSRSFRFANYIADKDDFLMLLKISGRLIRKDLLCSSWPKS